MPPRHSSQFVLRVEAVEGVEGNLNYFIGGPECKTETVEQVFAQARDAEASAEESLAWATVGRSSRWSRRRLRSTASGRRSNWSLATATRPSLSSGTATTTRPRSRSRRGLGRVHGREARKADGPQPQAEACLRGPLRVGARPGAGGRAGRRGTLDTWEAVADGATASQAGPCMRASFCCPEISGLPIFCAESPFCRRPRI